MGIQGGKNHGKVGQAGATLPEYALIIALFVVVLLGVVKVLESRSEAQFKGEAAKLKEIPTGIGGGSPATTVPVAGIAPNPDCTDQVDECKFTAQPKPPGKFFWQVLLDGATVRISLGNNTTQKYDPPDFATGYTMFLVLGENKPGKVGGDQGSMTMTCNGAKDASCSPSPAT